jgi:integrase/recombinase XerD
MSTKQRVNGPKRRGQTVKAQSAAGLAEVARATSRLWRKHHLSYDQTKYVVELARRALGVESPRTRRRTVQRLDYPEIERLIRSAYRDRSAYGVMIKTLFLTGARVNEFVHIRVEDLHLDDESPQIHLTHAKRQACRYVPVLPALAQELRTHLQGRRQGYLFESNRHTLYSARTVQAVVKRFAQQAGIAKRVYPHLLRHSIATILLSMSARVVSPSLALLRLGSYARQNRIHQALAEIGRVHKTIHILRTLDDEEYRRRMGRELNKGEASHELSRFLCFGKEGALRGREFGDQLHTFSCLSVLHNAVVAWNMVHIEPVLEQLRAEGQRCDDELLSLTAPLLRRHLNPFGRYYFDLVRMRQDGGQLVELPSEPSASERVGP